MATTAAPVERKAQNRLYIGGDWVDAADGRTFQTLHPATGEVIAEVAEAGPREIDAAVQAARTALAGPWSRMTAAERGNLLWKIADAIEARGAELARLETLDNGKPIREAQIDIREVVDCFRYYAGWATKLH